MPYLVMTPRTDAPDPLQTLTQQAAVYCGYSWCDPSDQYHPHQTHPPLLTQLCHQQLPIYEEETHLETPELLVFSITLQKNINSLRKYEDYVGFITSDAMHSIH